MKCFDSYGREVEIDRESWRTEVLPGNFQRVWNDPNQLAALIANALHDGFIADALEPARRLARTDSTPQRGVSYLAVILLQLKQFAEAEKVLKDALKRLGEDGVLLTNLAKAQSGLGNEALSEQTLWHALEVDPNQDNGMLWYVAIHRERGGEDAEREALERIAAQPKSWRAQLWRARQALERRELEPALNSYRESLSRAGTPPPTDLLQQISGDLGKKGHLVEALQLTEPHFLPTTHGLEVGNNLIKAHVDLGQLEAARRILDQLYALKRPDWQEHLCFWDTELAKARVGIADKAPQDEVKMTMLAIEGPVWLKPSSPATELFLAKSAEAPMIAFLGSSAEMATNSKRVELQLGDAPGRLSRTLPMFLAEQVEFGAGARTRTLIPWIVNPPGGFVVSGGPWKDEDASGYARQGEFKADYVVVSHLKTQAQPWIAELRLVRTIDGKCLGTLEVGFTVEKMQHGLTGLATQLIQLLAQQADVELQPHPPLYRLPEGGYFPHYMLRIEQLLSARCAAMDGVPAGFLHGEREMISGNIQLCADVPASVPTRIVMAQTVATLKRVRADILPEFKDRLELLQKEHPLAQPAHGIVQRILSEALTK
jgi:tetratricopeptide (TPR) repeat protein